MTRILPTIPPKLMIVDEDEPYPYLPNHIAQRPLRIPIRPLTSHELDTHLETDDRHSKPFLYNQHCDSCSACEPLRIDVQAFEPSKTQKQMQKLDDHELMIKINDPIVDAERITLFDKHEEEQNLQQRERSLDTQKYAQFLIESTTPTIKLRYHKARTGRLISITITDHDARSLSTIYTYYDPDLIQLSPNMYSILTQLQLCQQ